MDELKEFKIKNRCTGDIIVCGKYRSMKDCLEKNRGADLTRADLTGANLTGADLTRANLYGADLTRADLYGADLTRANLYGANLTGADLTGADLTGANLYGANLTRADLTGANLTGANLTGADLTGANLTRADLSGANLSGADLTRANLYGADLTRANVVYGLNNLYCLKLFPEETILFFWKYLKNGLSPYQNYKYEIGQDYQFEDCNQDERDACGKGGNVATLQWCLKDNNIADEFIEVEFRVKDIVAIPYFTDGKFRVKKFKVLRKINRKEAIELIMSKMNKT